MQKTLITNPQIRGARALLGWSANDLSDKSGIGISTFKRLKVMDGVPAININTMVARQARSAPKVNYLTIIWF